MSERLPMPSGAWIEIRDWRELRRGDKKKALSQVADLDRQVEATYAVADQLLSLLITSWSYPGMQIPSINPDALDQLPFEDDVALMQAVQPAIRALMGRPAEPTEEQVEDPASPTEPSDG